MWTQKMRYALRALIVLAGMPGERTSVREIAEEQAIPQKYLEAILGELRVAGIVTSTKGPRGGYELARDVDGLSLFEIIRAVDSDWAAGCAEPKGASGAPEEGILQETAREIYKKMKDVTIGDALRLWKERRNVLDYVI